MKREKLQLLIHIMGCTVFLSLPVLFSPDLTSPISLYSIPPFQRDFVGYLILVLFFYLNYYVLIPKLYFRKKYTVFAAITLLSFLLVSVIPNILIPYTNFAPNTSNACAQAVSNFMPLPFNQSFFRFFSHHFFEFLMVCILSLLLKINSRLKFAEKERVNAELSYLKAQINPHFLFNTLNSIYSLAIAKSDYTPTAVVKLSDMMRYVITDASHKFVPLQKEINYVSDYIELQKLRIDNTIKLTYSVTGNFDNKKIAPLVLISFIENAFKYGVNAEENSLVKIDIDVTKSYLHLRVFNKKVNTQKQVSESNSGLGIENTQNRLQLLYPGSHKLVIKNNKEDFSILLSLYLI